MCLPCLGGTGVPCPPLCVSSGTCLVSFSFTLALGRALVLLWEGGWRGGVGGGGGGWGGGLGVWGLRPAVYLNRARPAPSSHYGLCTLILCAGTRDPLMHLWVARTIVMATLLVAYPHVCE